MPDWSDWLLPLIVQLPLVAVVAWYFDRREKKLQADHQAELKRRTDTLTTRADDWHSLHDQERDERLEAQRQLVAVTGEVRGVLEALQDLTKEVIRNAGK